MPLISIEMTSWKSWKLTSQHFVVLICIGLVFLYLNQNILSPNLSLIASDFKFSSQDRDQLLGGIMSLAYFASSSVSSIVFGIITDYSNRVELLGLIFLFAHLSSLFSSLSSNFEQLLVCRVGMGIAAGSANPVVFSLIGDLVSDQHRIYGSTMVSMAVALGVGFGPVFSGPIGIQYGWRYPLYIVSAVLGVVGVTLLVIREDKWRPIKSNSLPINAIDNVETSSNSFVVKVRNILSCPSIIICYCQSIPGCISWSVVNIFLFDYLVNDLHHSVKIVSFLIVILGIGGIVGQVAGSYVLQHVYNCQKSLVGPLVGVCACLAMVPLQLILYSKDCKESNCDFSYFLYLAFCFFSITCLGASMGPTVRSILQVVWYFLQLAAFSY